MSIARSIDNNNKKSVSIVMATYNGARYIDEQFKSLVGQTFKPLEIIISDDASNDETVDKVYELSREVNDIGIKIIRNASPLGFRDNFLRASMDAQGDFIAFCDQDDIWDKTKLEKCSNYFYDDNIAMITHAAYTIDEKSTRIGSFNQGIESTCVRPPLCYDPWMTFYGFSIVFRRDLLNIADIHNRFIDYIVPAWPIAHDRWIMFLAQMVGSTVEISDKLVGYRQHPNNLFGVNAKKRKTVLRNTRSRSSDYILATRQMIDIVAKFPDSTSQLFPQFRREKCISFLERALRQLEARDAIYLSSSRVRALYGIIDCLMSSRYRAVHNNRTRWRSILKDIRFAMLANH